MNQRRRRKRGTPGCIPVTSAAATMAYRDPEYSDDSRLTRCLGETWQPRWHWTSGVQPGPNTTLGEADPRREGSRMGWALTALETPQQPRRHHSQRRLHELPAVAPWGFAPHRSLVSVLQSIEKAEPTKTLLLIGARAGQQVTGLGQRHRWPEWVQRKCLTPEPQSRNGLPPQARRELQGRLRGSTNPGPPGVTSTVTVTTHKGGHSGMCTRYRNAR